MSISEKSLENVVAESFVVEEYLYGGPYRVYQCALNYEIAQWNAIGIVIEFII